MFKYIIIPQLGRASSLASRSISECAMKMPVYARIGMYVCMYVYIYIYICIHIYIYIYIYTHIVSLLLLLSSLYYCYYYYYVWPSPSEPSAGFTITGSPFFRSHAFSCYAVVYYVCRMFVVNVVIACVVVLVWLRVWFVLVLMRMCLVCVVCGAFLVYVMFMCFGATPSAARSRPAAASSWART